jgi:hypothetical protein
MGLIGPKVTWEELAESAQQTIDGKGRRKGLSGVKADAQAVDKKAHKRNRAMAELISKAVAELKEIDDGVPRFVLGWRLYPNRDNPYWKTEALKHNCGCGCGCFGRPPPPPPPPDYKSKSRPKKKAKSRSKK